MEEELKRLEMESQEEEWQNKNHEALKINEALTQLSGKILNTTCIHIYSSEET